jgi:replicative DNA helicase
LAGVAPSGCEPVFDLTVEGAHNFVADNVIVHNSLEQDSDLVLFLYSEDYYKEAAQRPEMPVVHLHLAKHRNGPTGSVEMVFIPRETRFEEKARG